MAVEPGFTAAKGFDMFKRHFSAALQKSMNLSLFLVWAAMGCSLDYTLNYEHDSETTTQTENDTGTLSSDTTTQTENDTGTLSATTSDSAFDTDCPLQETTLFYESFEDIGESGTGKNKISGWVVFGHPDYVHLEDESGGQFTTAWGTQVLSLYTSEVFSQTHFETTSARFDEKFTENTTYTLSFNAGRRSNEAAPTSAYLVGLWAKNDSTGVETHLDSVSGVVSGSDMSESNILVFKTGSNHANLGERIAIRLSKMDEASNRTVILYDNVRLTASCDQ
ncbi:MAG: hypothetical protein MUC50_18730 [Myxococcota bacterium]|jgi:hypothetical protein|nr:hypothetical protein [Myxococcota bacterium]